MNLFGKGRGKGASVIFILVLVMSVFVQLYSGEIAGDDQSATGTALADNSLPAGSEAGENGVRVQFDARVKSKDNVSEGYGSGDKIMEIEPSRTKKTSAASFNIIVPKDAEAKKACAGLLKTVLDITPADGGLKLDFSLQNIAEQDLSLYFSSSQKFDILVSNRNGEEVYRWSRDKGFAAVIVEAKLKKCEKLSFSELWDCKNNQGNTVLPGKYTITVTIPAKLKDRRTIDPGALTAAKDIEIAT